MRTTIRVMAVLVTLAVTGVAAWASYWHVTDFVTAGGQGGILGHAYAVTIDGLLVIASLALIVIQRENRGRRAFAYTVATAGVLMTLWANISGGLSHGFHGAVVAMWPALAFAAAYELLLTLLRSSIEPVLHTVMEAVTQPVTAALPDPEPATVTQPATAPAPVIEAPVIEATVIEAPAAPAPRDEVTVTGSPEPGMPDPAIPDDELTVRQLARRRGCSERTIYRERAEAKKARAATGTPPLTRQMLEAA